MLKNAEVLGVLQGVGLHAASIRGVGNRSFALSEAEIRNLQSQTPGGHCKCRIAFESGKKISGTAEVEQAVNGGKGKASVAYGKNKRLTLIADCTFPYCPIRHKFVDLVNNLPPHISCVVGGTQILTPDGSIPVEQLKPGDLVVGLGGEVSKVFYVVQSLLGNRSLIGFNDGAPFCTPEHLLRDKHGRAVCGDKEGLKLERCLLNMNDVGDLHMSTLLKHDGEEKVENVTTIALPESTKVYEIVLENLDSTYFANLWACASYFPEMAQFSQFFHGLGVLAIQQMLDLPKYDDDHANLQEAALLLVQHNKKQLEATLTETSSKTWSSFIEVESFAPFITAHDNFPTCLCYLYWASGVVLDINCGGAKGDTTESVCTVVAAGPQKGD